MGFSEQCEAHVLTNRQKIFTVSWIDPNIRTKYLGSGNPMNPLQDIILIVTPKINPDLLFPHSYVKKEILWKINIFLIISNNNFSCKNIKNK